MPLEIQRGRSKWFYGRVVVNGRTIHQNLNVRIEGVPPASLREEGDAAFERSRARAQVALERFEAELRSKANEEDLIQRVIEIRTGSRMRSVELSQMATRWVALPRRRKMAQRYQAVAVADIGRFAAFIAKQHPRVKEMSAVTDTMALAFMAAEEARGISPKRYNDVLKLLRSGFSRLRKEAGLAANPFDEIPTKESATIHRKPFTVSEIEEILQKAQADAFIYPLVVLAVCTAMRLGDCANLNWAQVDLENGFIDVKTAKTGRLVTIPVFPLLRALLAAQVRMREGYVFPDFAKQYRIAPDVLTKRVRRVMWAAGFGDPREGALTRGAFHATREQGLRRASIRDVHSFRVTWVTLALNAGVPIDLVRKVTGQQTVEVVLTSYHQPGREDYRRELSAKLPMALTGGLPPGGITFQVIRAKLAAMTTDTWQVTRAELLQAIDERP